MAPVAGLLGLTSVRLCETIFDELGSEDEHCLKLTGEVGRGWGEQTMAGWLVLKTHNNNNR